MKPILFAATLAALFAAAPPVRAADGELSLDARRMMAYGTLAVLTGICETPMTPAQKSEMNNGLQKAAAAQTQFTPAEFTEMMKSVGTQVGQNKAEACAGTTPDFVALSLKQAANGE